MDLKAHLLKTIKEKIIAIQDMIYPDDWRSDGANMKSWNDVKHDEKLREDWIQRVYKAKLEAFIRLCLRCYFQETLGRWHLWTKRTEKEEGFIYKQFVFTCVPPEEVLDAAVDILPDHDIKEKALKLKKDSEIPSSLKPSSGKRHGVMCLCPPETVSMKFIKKLELQGLIEDLDLTDSWTSKSYFVPASNTAVRVCTPLIDKAAKRLIRSSPYMEKNFKKLESCYMELKAIHSFLSVSPTFTKKLFKRGLNCYYNHEHVLELLNRSKKIVDSYGY